MQLSQIFKTDKEINEAKECLERLSNNPDWQFLSENIIQANINELTDRILDSKEKWPEGEEAKAKSNREHWIMLSELPNKLLEGLREKPTQETNQDPYHLNYKEIKKR